MKEKTFTKDIKICFDKQRDALGQKGSIHKSQFPLS